MARRFAAFVLCLIFGSSFFNPCYAAQPRESLFFEQFHFNAAGGTVFSSIRRNDVLLNQSINFAGKHARIDLNGPAKSGFIQIQIGVNGPDTLRIDVGFGGKTASAILIETHNSPPAFHLDPSFPEADFVNTLRDLASSDLGQALVEVSSLLESEAPDLVGSFNRLCPGSGNPLKERLNKIFGCMGDASLNWSAGFLPFLGLVGAGLSLIMVTSCLSQAAGCGAGGGDWVNCMNETNKC
jgi:hypothetical protein